MKKSIQKYANRKLLQYVLAFSTLFFLLESCRKEKDENFDISPQPSGDAFRMLTVPAYKGVYVDSFDFIVGDTARENSLLRWCKKQSLNALSLYDTKTILSSSSNYPKLAAFIKKARSKYGIKSVAAVRSLSSQFTGSTSTYNKSRVDTQERFNVFNLENEYWNAGTNNTFSNWIKIVNTMNTKAHAATPRITSEFYFGWFQNPNNQEPAQAAKMVAATDRILLHDYWAAPSLTYMQSRLAFLGQEAFKQNKVIDIVVLFSTEQAFAYDYFNVNTQNHSFLDAYNSMLAQHNASTFAGKDNIRIIGYQLFCQSIARSARP